MEARYLIRSEDGAWTIFDSKSDLPALLNGVPQRQLSRRIANDLAEALNCLVAAEIMDPDVRYTDLRRVGPDRDRRKVRS